MIEIRPFRKSEKEHWSFLWGAYLVEHGLAVDKRILNANWAHMHDRKHPFNAVVALCDGVPAGFLDTVDWFNPHYLKPTLYVSDMYVLPRFRRKGIARKLMKFAFRGLGEGRFARIEWKTMNGNKAARGLYDEISQKTDWVIYEKYKRKKK